MIIKNLRVEEFGKLKGLEVELTPGLNVIYGENEAGKSTLQSFIKAMFYGMNSKRQGIRENDRKRFLPWSGTYGSGEIHFEDEYKNEYIIKRRFGLKRKEDHGEIIYAITGDTVAHIDPFKPGEDIFGIGEESFEKTVFIKQLGSKVDQDREDEIMKRLTNLEQTGDENISYTKAMDALQRGKKTLISPRKAGKLDKLKEEYEGLQKEFYESLILHEKNIEDQIKLNGLMEEKILIINTIEKLENHKKEMKLYELHREYDGLKNYLQKIKQLTREREEIAAALLAGDQIIEEKFIGELKGKYLAWKQQKKQTREMEELINTLKAQIEKNEVLLEKFCGFKGLSGDITFQITAMENGICHIEKRLQEITRQQLEIKKLEEQLIIERRSLGSFSKFQLISDHMETDILNQEEQLKVLKYKVDNDTKKDHLNFKRDILMDQVKGVGAVILIGLFTAMAGLIGGWMKHNGLYILSVVGICLSIYGGIKRGKIKAQINRINDEIKGYEDMDSTREESNRISKSLKKTYDELGVDGYHEFTRVMRSYNDKKSSIGTLQTKIEEKKYQMDGEEEEELRRKLTYHRQFIQRVLTECQCENLDIFEEKRKNYGKIMDDKITIEKEQDHMKKRLDDVWKDVEILEKEIRDMLRPLNMEDNGIEQIDDVIHDLEGMLQRKIEMERKILSVKEIYNGLLKGRDMKIIEKELQDTSRTMFNDDRQDEESLEGLLKEKHQNLITIEKLIKDMEYKMTERFHLRKTTTQIEEEMEIIKGGIDYYEEMKDSIDEAVSTLEESFKEIQRSFGPRLNRMAGDILDKITVGRYNQLKISESYEIKVVDPIENQIKEVDFFSNGTWDQVYFALRMGITALVLGEDRSIPLILDDAFIQYDDTRVKAVLKYLYEYGKKNQVILFTCQKREEQMLRDFSDINIIYM